MYCLLYNITTCITTATMTCRLFLSDAIVKPVCIFHALTYKYCTFQLLSFVYTHCSTMYLKVDLLMINVINIHSYCIELLNNILTCIKAKDIQWESCLKLVMGPLLCVNFLI